MRIVTDRASAVLDDLVIPELAVSPDRPPTNPSIYDDEFESAGSGGWVISSGDRNTTVPSCLYLASAQYAYRNGVPPAPFTVTAKMAAVNYDNLASTFGNASLGLAVASPGNGFGTEWDIANLGNISFYGLSFTLPTPGFTSNLGSLTYEVPGYGYQGAGYHRLIVHSATNVDFAYSLDGLIFFSIYTGYNPSLTIGSVVFLSYACRTAWDWVRFTTP